MDERTLLLEDEDLDELERDDSSLQDGPYSSQIELTMGNIPEDEELSFLRKENALLRRKIKELEKPTRKNKAGLKVADDTEVARIDALLKKAEEAKAEALNYVANTSRDKLGQDVKVLQAILKKAKAERHAFKKRIKTCEEQLRSEQAKFEQEEIRFQVDREIFAKILKDDRDSYKHEVTLLVEKLTALQKEKHELFLWAKEQQHRHLQEIRKLTRALGRAKKGIEEQKIKSLDILNEVRNIHANALRPTSS